MPEIAIDEYSLEVVGGVRDTRILESPGRCQPKFEPVRILVFRPVGWILRACFPEHGSAGFKFAFSAGHTRRSSRLASGSFRCNRTPIRRTAGIWVRMAD
jgi:hypothetical protein